MFVEVDRINFVVKGQQTGEITPPPPTESGMSWLALVGVGLLVLLGLKKESR